jgi:hypothetical protein
MQSIESYEQETKYLNDAKLVTFLCGLVDIK